MNFTVEISNDLYPKQAVLEARLAYREYAVFEVMPTKINTVSLTIKPMKKFEDNSREIVLSFLNYALDLAANYQLERDK